MVPICKALSFVVFMQLFFVVVVVVLFVCLFVCLEKMQELYKMYTVTVLSSFNKGS